MVSRKSSPGTGRIGSLWRDGTISIAFARWRRQSDRRVSEPARLQKLPPDRGRVLMVPVPGVAHPSCADGGAHLAVLGCGTPDSSVRRCRGRSGRRASRNRYWDGRGVVLVGSHLTDAWRTVSALRAAGMQVIDPAAGCRWFSELAGTVLTSPLTRGRPSVWLGTRSDRARSPREPTAAGLANPSEMVWQASREWSDSTSGPHLAELHGRLAQTREQLWLMAPDLWRDLPVDDPGFVRSHAIAGRCWPGLGADEGSADVWCDDDQVLPGVGEGAVHCRAAAV